MLDSFQDVFRHLTTCLDSMREEASGNGMLYGLRGFPQYYSRRHTTRWEQVITGAIARKCSDFIGQQEPAYPTDVTTLPEWPHLPRGQKRPRGDLLITMDNSPPLFVECKSIFECVLRCIKKKPLEYQGIYYYYDSRANNENILDDAQNAQTSISIEQARIDAIKMNCLWQLGYPQYHLGLLLLEFDRNDQEKHRLSNRRDYQNLEEWLRRDNWLAVDRITWPDSVSVRADKGFQEHMILWVKSAA